MFGGLRMSEFRGLWKASCELEPDRAKVKIVRRADRYNELGSVKSAAGLRTIEIGSETATSIHAYLENCTVKSDLAFSNEEGNVWSYPNFWHRFWVPLMNAAGLVTVVPASKAVRGGVWPKPISGNWLSARIPGGMSTPAFRSSRGSCPSVSRS